MQRKKDLLSLLLCSLIMHEEFSGSEIVSFVFFIAAVILFTVGEIKHARMID